MDGKKQLFAFFFCPLSPSSDPLHHTQQLLTFCPLYPKQVRFQFLSICFQLLCTPLTFIPFSPFPGCSPSSYPNFLFSTTTRPVFNLLSHLYSNYEYITWLSCRYRCTINGFAISHYTPWFLFFSTHHFNFYINILLYHYNCSIYQSSVPPHLHTPIFFPPLLNLALQICISFQFSQHFFEPLTSLPLYSF